MRRCVVFLPCLILSPSWTLRVAIVHELETSEDQVSLLQEGRFQWYVLERTHFVCVTFCVRHPWVYSVNYGLWRFLRSLRERVGWG